VDGTDGEREQRVLACQQLAGSTVVGNERGQDSESTSSFGDCDGLGQFANHQQEEGDVEEEEQGHQAIVDSQGTKEEQEGDDEPRRKENTDRVVFLSTYGGVLVRVSDTGTRDEDGSIRQPETTIRRKGGGAKRVTGSKLPHASEQLSKTSYKESHTDYGVGNNDSSGLNIEHGQDECRGREREESKRTGVTQNPEVGTGVVQERGGCEGSSVVSLGTTVQVLSVVRATVGNRSFLDIRHY